MVQSKIIGVPATQELINQMKGRLRQADRQEIRASHNINPDRALELSFQSSERAYVGLLEGLPMIAFGVVRPSLLSRIGVIWMLSTPEIEANLSRFSLGKRCIRYVADLLRDFDEIGNYIDIRNKISLKWLQWIGFTIEPPEPYGIYNMLFSKFYIRKK